MDLEGQQKARKRRAEGYEDLRRELRTAASLAETEQELKDLREGWGDAKRDLDAAIDDTPEIGLESLSIAHTELLRSRATANSQLREDSAARRDVEDSRRAQTVEGLLLSGMAGRNSERASRCRASRPETFSPSSISRLFDWPIAPTWEIFVGSVRQLADCQGEINTAIE